ncbi:MAG: S1/P1 nuclease [Alistipes sp.]|nr:S1/P1 nuclease [Alistipes sp.]
MKKLAAVFAVLMIFVGTGNSYGWGQKGHDIVAYIAQCNLKKGVKKKVIRALDGHTLMYYSSWMDNIRSFPEYRHTSTWHYANVDEGYTYETMPKEPAGDVYTALTDVIEKLKDHKNLPDSLENQYLRFLIHLVGDMHCPMHAGRKTDLGGNQLKVKWFGSDTNIHSVWDTALIKSVRKWSYIEWRDNLDILSKEEKARLAAGTPLDWMNETVNVCKHIYLNVEEGENLSWDYMYYNFPVLELQLQKAGYRLARILNEIY